MVKINTILNNVIHIIDVNIKVNINVDIIIIIIFFN